MFRSSGHPNNIGQSCQYKWILSEMEGAGSRAAIVAFYKKASYCYLFPFGLAALGFFLPDFIGGAFIFTLLPCAIAGLYFAKRGLALSTKSKDLEKKDVGYANLLLGIIIGVLGMLGLALVGIM